MANICFDCQRALPLRGCPWADKFEPVEGWTATIIPIKGGRIHKETYHITNCPLFKADKSLSNKSEIKKLEDKPPLKKSEIKKHKQRYIRRPYILQYTPDKEFIAEFLNTFEAAKAIGVSTKTLRRMIRYPFPSDKFIFEREIRYEKKSK